jgi:hypothetical protein
MCGVKKLRKDLHAMKVIDMTKHPFMGDCEVTDWVAGVCTKTCGAAGGKQNITREVVYVPAM